MGVKSTNQAGSRAESSREAAKTATGIEKRTHHKGEPEVEREMQDGNADRRQVVGDEDSAVDRAREVEELGVSNSARNYHHGNEAAKAEHQQLI